MLKRYLYSDIYLVILFFTGIVLLGSGVDWFPWANILGIAMIGCSGLLSIRKDDNQLKGNM